MKRIPVTCPCCKKRLPGDHRNALRMAKELAAKSGNDEWEPSLAEMLCARCHVSQGPQKIHITEFIGLRARLDQRLGGE